MESQETKEEDVSKSTIEQTKEAKIVYKTISGGLIPLLAKSVLEHGIFWILVYILGLYNFNWKVRFGLKNKITMRNVSI